MLMSRSTIRRSSSSSYDASVLWLSLATPLLVVVVETSEDETTKIIKCSRQLIINNYNIWNDKNMRATSLEWQ